MVPLVIALACFSLMLHWLDRFESAFPASRLFIDMGHTLWVKRRTIIDWALNNNAMVNLLRMFPGSSSFLFIIITFNINYYANTDATYKPELVVTYVGTEIETYGITMKSGNLNLKSGNLTIK